jgi:MoxR-like ATPase
MAENETVRNLDPILTRFRDIRSELNAAFRQRSVEIEVSLVGLATGLHAIMIGAPGDGKTALAQAIGNKIVDGSHFSVGLSKSSTDADIFGGPDVPHIVKTGAYRRNTNGFAPTATTLLLDEAFKAEGALLQACLRFFSENEFEGKPTELLWAAIASNELPPELRGATNGLPMDLGPLEESLMAFMDRFFYSLEVRSLDPGSTDWEAVVFNDVTDNLGTTTVTKDEVRALQRGVKSVVIPNNVLESIRRLATALPLGLDGVPDSSVRVSARTWRKAMTALRGHALIDGRTTVKMLDLKWLQHAFWTTPDQRSVIAEQIGKVLSERMGEADASVRKVEEYVDAMRNKVLVRDEASENKLKIEHGRISDEDPRRATVAPTLLEFIEREIAALQNALQSADDEDDIDAVQSAIQTISTKKKVIERSVASALMNRPRKQR